MADEGQQEGGDARGDEISEERKGELEQRLQAWEQEGGRGERKGPFDCSGLTFEESESRILSGADMFWLAARTLAGTDEALAVAEQMERMRRARDKWEERATLDRTPLQFTGANLREANLSGAYLGKMNLSHANLDEANFSDADLSEANLSEALLYGADFSKALLYRTDLTRANLNEADLLGALLHQANLSNANLQRANLSNANLEQANLSNANLEWTDLSGADLRGGRMSVETILSAPLLSATTLLADVIWNGAPLARVSWETLPTLGDETRARQPQNSGAKEKDAVARLAEYEAAVRAYRLLAVTLRSQGLNEHADHYAYRAQLMQRVVLRRQAVLRWAGQHSGLRQRLRKLAAYTASGLLDLIAGYGYRPLRTLFWYLAVIGAFAYAYFQATHGALTFGLPPSQLQPLSWYEALVLSVSSFHGRGFFQPVQSLGDPVAILAAIEAVFGLFIEVSFIATFTQRYFGK